MTKKLTHDEEADLIVHKLKTAPKRPNSIEDDLLEMLIQEIQKEIDAEILAEIHKPGMSEEDKIIEILKTPPKIKSRIEVITQQVNAKSRMLKAKWTTDDI